MENDSLPIRPQAEGTARDLIDAAIHVIGTKGFAAASTREIAKAAGTNVASIAYHFGNKEGLRQACAREFAARIGAIVQVAQVTEPETPDEAAKLLGDTIERMGRVLIADGEMRAMVAFVLREVAEDGPGADALYTALALPMHSRLCRLWAIASGEEAESDAVKLRVFSFIGQLVYFRIGAPIVARRLGWDAIGPDEAERIARVLRGNFDAVLARARKADK